MRKIKIRSIFECPSLPEVEGVITKHVPNHPGIAVSDNGDVWSCRRLGLGAGADDHWRRLKITESNHSNGSYATISIACSDNKCRRFKRSIFVCMAFHGEKADQSLYACHKDGDTLHDHPDNLYWGTPTQNYADMVRHGTINQAHGDKVWMTKLTEEQVFEIRKLHGQFGYRKLAQMFGVDRCTIRAIILGKSWAWLKEAA